MGQAPLTHDQFYNYGYGNGLARCYIACKSPPPTLIDDGMLYFPQRGILYTCRCCTNFDDILYSQLNYEGPEVSRQHDGEIERK